MNRLKEKLKSQEGASLLLSLLVFLLCIMVAASVLAAAVSNAGKAKSSRVEQQRYQTLSSAVGLICGELEKVEYKGKYTVYTWSADGKDYFYCEQQESEKITMQTAYSGQTFQIAKFAFMDGILNKEMDDIFRRQFRKSNGSEEAKDGYGPLEDDDVITAGGAAADPIRLTVTLPPGLAGYPYATGSTPGRYEIPKTANIEIKLDHKTGNIELTAWLDDSGASVPSGKSGVMVAELTADAIPVPEIPDPNSVPGDKADIPSDPAKVTVEEKTVTVTWKLDSMSITTAP